MSEEVLIEVKNLRRVFQDGDVATTALDGLSFSIKKGEFVAIMGPSGSGKSTLLNILGFLDRPTEGEYLFEGRGITQYTDEEIAHVRNARMGFIFQSFNLLARSTVFDNVQLPLMYSDAKEKDWEAIANKAISEVGLDHRINHTPSQLSGGEKQRVAVARALVNQPSVIFADEPTGNLDSKTGGSVMAMIEELNKKGHTIVLITHETFTAEFAERIISIKDGKVDSDVRVENRRTSNQNFIK
jgi:putative ABC transport system ATP-binding protein